MKKISILFNGNKEPVISIMNKLFNIVVEQIHSVDFIIWLKQCKFQSELPHLNVVKCFRHHRRIGWQFDVCLWFFFPLYSRFLGIGMGI